MDVIDQLRQRLAVLQPEHIEIEDESHLHAGHAGARNGGKHLRLKIVSSAFAGQSTLQRHRTVYAAAGDLMQGAIHALIIDAKTPNGV